MGRPVEALLASSETTAPVGSPLSSALPEDEETRKTVVAAYALLGRRAFSRAELRTRLARTAASSEAVDGALEWLVSRRLVDDQRYAAEAVRAGVTRKGWGPRKVRQWLQQRGIDAQVAQDSLAAVPVEQEAEQAASLAARQRARGRRPDQVFRFLVTRGFSAAVARAAALEGEAQGEPADVAGALAGEED